MKNLSVELSKSAAKGDAVSFFGLIGEKLFDERAWEQMFVDVGAWIASYEKDGSEEADARAVVFSECNMRTFARKMRAVDGFDWKGQFEQEVEALLANNELSDVNKKRCRKNFHDMIMGRLKQQYEQIYGQMILEQINGQTAEIKQLYEQILEREAAVEEMFRKMQDENQHTRQESKSTEFSGEETHSHHVPKWNLKSHHINGRFANMESREAEIIVLTNLWREERKKYPGWYILPANICQELKYKTIDMGLITSSDGVDAERMLLYAYELVWRYEKCMHLYNGYELASLQQIWDTCLTAMASGEEKPPYAKKWFYIGQALLRCYRENAQHKEWKKLYQTMRKYADYGTNGKEDLLLENAKYAYYRMDIADLRRTISKCSFPETMFEQRLQVLGLRVECGELQIALGELQKLYEDIKKRLEEEIVEDNYRIYCMSLQSCLLQLRSVCLQANAYQNGDYELEQIEIDQVLKEMEQNRELFDWNAWKNRTEHELLSSMAKKHMKTEAFELNRENVTIISSGTACEASYAFYRVMERLALPLKCGMVTSVADIELVWIQSILELNVNLGSFLLVRGNKSDSIKVSLDRAYISSLEQKAVECWIQTLIDALNSNLAEMHVWDWQSGDLASHICENVPEMLWRLSDRASYSQQEQNLLLLKKLMEDEELSARFPFTIFMIQILKRTSEKVKAQMFAEMMTTDICEHRTMHGRGDGIDLFDCYFNKEEIGPLENLCHVKPETVEWLLESEWSSDYEWNTKVTRLGVLHAHGLLNETQYQDYARLVWSNVSEKTNYPQLNNRWMYTLEQLPYIDEKIPQTSVKAYFLQNCLTDLMKDSDGCQMHMGNIPYLDELTMLCGKLDKDYWTEDEREQLLENILAYWQVLQEDMEKTQNSYCFDEYQSRADKMAASVAAVIRNTSYPLSRELSQRLSAMLLQMQHYHVMAGELEVCLGASPAWLENTRQKMMSSDRRTVIDAMTGAYQYIQMYPETDGAGELLEEILFLIACGRTVGLRSAVWTVHNLVYVQSDVFTQNLVDRTNQSLLLLAQHVALQAGVDLPVKEKLGIRVAAAALAFRLSIWDKYACGEGVELWRQICAREEESAEVKKEWIY